MENPTLFEEPLLKDLEEEVTTALGSVYGVPLIKKVLDLLRNSTPFHVVVAVTPYPCICSLFSHFPSLLLMDFHAYERIWGLHGQVLRRPTASTQPALTPARRSSGLILQCIGRVQDSRFGK